MACWWTMRAKPATVLLRGIRAISDYEYELQMALMNRRLQPEDRNRLPDGAARRIRSSARGW